MRHGCCCKSRVTKRPAGPDQVVTQGALLEGIDARQRLPRSALRASVLNSTRMQPRVSNAGRSGRYFASMLMAERCQAGVIQDAIGLTSRMSFDISPVCPQVWCTTLFPGPSGVKSFDL